MSVMDVTARIQQIQSQLAQLAPPAPRTAGTSSASFASALDRAGGLLAPGGSTGSAGSGAGQAVVAEARKYLGVPYVWGGTDPQQGLDCSGLVQLVYKNLGYDLPRVSYQQATSGRPVASMAQAQPGDLLAFNSPVSHIGIYIGDGKMIHAPRPGEDVEVSEVYDTPTAIRRVIPDAPTSAAGLDGLSGTAAAARVDAGTPYADLFARASTKYGIDAGLLSAIARQESGYDPTAVSSAGAQGLMQLMPATAEGLGVANSFDPSQAVDGAAKLMRDLLDRFGRTDLALAAYNAGPGAVLRYDGIPPYRETQDYVRSITSMLGDAA